MFPSRGLFLLVIISLTNIVLADILVQPGYEHQFGNNPYYSTVPQYKESTQLPGFQAVNPYYASYQDQARSHHNQLSYPYHRQLYHHNDHYFHHLPKLHPHYTKIGGREYVRPSVFVGYPQPITTVHHPGTRYKRSSGSESTRTESSKSTIVTHDNDVAAKSPLTDVKHLTTVDSLLPEHEPTDTNDKSVKNRQIPNNNPMARPGLFGLYPDGISPEYHSGPNKNIMHMRKKILPHFPIVDQQPSSKQNCEKSIITTNKSSGRMNPWEKQASDDDDNDYHSSKYRNTWFFSEPEPDRYILHDINKLIYVRNPPIEKAEEVPDETPQVGKLEDIGQYYIDPETFAKLYAGQMRAASQELENKSFQETTNMNMIDLIPRQEKMKMMMPYSSRMLSKTINAPITTPIQSQPYLSNIQHQNRNKEEFSGTKIANTPSARGREEDLDKQRKLYKVLKDYEELIQITNINPYYDGILPPQIPPFNYPNYSKYPSSSLKKYYHPGNADFYKKNSNSVNSIEPSIEIPDYTNISAQRNLPIMQRSEEEPSFYIFSGKKVQNLITPYYKYDNNFDPNGLSIYEFIPPIFITDAYR